MHVKKIYTCIHVHVFIFCIASTSFYVYINTYLLTACSHLFTARTRNSIAVSSFDHMYQNNKRPHSIISISSTSSSSSSHSGAFHPHHLPPDTSRTTNYLSNGKARAPDILVFIFNILSMLLYIFMMLYKIYGSCSMGMNKIKIFSRL